MKDDAKEPKLIANTDFSVHGYVRDKNNCEILYNFGNMSIVFGVCFW